MSAPAGEVHRVAARPGREDHLGPDRHLARRGPGADCQRHPAAARRIAWRLWRTFVSDVDEPSPEMLEGLAAPMRVNGDVDVARGLEVLLRSRLFHSDCLRRPPRGQPGGVGRQRRARRRNISAASRPDRGHAAADRMGQRLFQPPNVAGWPGGLEWLSDPALVARANFAAWLTGDESKVPADHWSQLARDARPPGDAEIDFWTCLFWGRTPTAAERGRWRRSWPSRDPVRGQKCVATLLCAAAAQMA